MFVFTYAICMICIFAIPIGLVFQHQHTSFIGISVKHNIRAHFRHIWIRLTPNQTTTTIITKMLEICEDIWERWKANCNNKNTDFGSHMKMHKPQLKVYEKHRILLEDKNEKFYLRGKRKHIEGLWWVFFSTFLSFVSSALISVVKQITTKCIFTCSDGVFNGLTKKKTKNAAEIAFLRIRIILLLSSWPA